MKSEVFVIYTNEIKLLHDISDNSVSKDWRRGVILGEGQNLARHLMETPANHMTPTKFAEIAEQKLGSLDKVTVTVRSVIK